MPSLGFKHCPSCGVAIPNNDSHTRCVLCLGERYIKERCSVDKSFKRTQVARDLCFEAAHYGSCHEACFRAGDCCISSGPLESPWAITDGAACTDSDSLPRKKRNHSFPRGTIRRRTYKTGLVCSRVQRNFSSLSRRSAEPAALVFQYVG